MLCYVSFTPIFKKKKNEALIYASVWMNLENIKLSEKKSVTKGHTLYDPVYEVSRAVVS